MIEMLKRHEIQVLRRAGHSLEEVAKLADVSPSSVQRVEAESPVKTLDTAGERVRRGVVLGHHAPARIAQVAVLLPVRADRHL